MLTTATTEGLHEALNLNSYLGDGFEKVCDVATKRNKKFVYQNINHSVMYAYHNSWVYMIVSGDEVVKVGETGNPLGIEKMYSDQPLSGTKCRLGRLANMADYSGYDTDERIRYELHEDCKEGKVSIYAKKCDEIKVVHSIGGYEFTINATIHKDLELLYLDYIEGETGSYPRLNAGRK